MPFATLTPEPTAKSQQPAGVEPAADQRPCGNVQLRGMGYEEATEHLKPGGGAGTPSIPPERPYLRVGSRGPHVESLQTLLHLADESLAIDSIFGLETHGAVIQFQLARKLLVDGIVGPQTWGALATLIPSSSQSFVGASAGAGTTTAPPPLEGDPVVGAIGSTHRTLKPGDTGIAVHEAQMRMSAHFMRVAADKGQPPAFAPYSSGVYDMLTEAMVHAFQKTNGLPSRPEIGPQMWDLLDREQTAAAYVERRGEQELAGPDGLMTTHYHSKYSWIIAPPNMVVFVKMNFSGPAAGQASRAIQHIHDVWNQFKLVNRADPSQQLPICFLVGQSKGGAETANIWLEMGDSAQSDMDNWYVDHDLRTVASHEFGHHIGLVDEYALRISDYQRITGERVGLSAQGGILALTMHDILFNVPFERRGHRLMAFYAQHGLEQNAPQTMSLAHMYAVLKGRDVTEDIAAKMGPYKGLHIERFGFHTNSVMGKPPTGGGSFSPEPRHMREFATAVQEVAGGDWTAVRR